MRTVDDSLYNIQRALWANENPALETLCELVIALIDDVRLINARHEADE